MDTLIDMHIAKLFHNVLPYTVKTLTIILISGQHTIVA